MANEMVDQELKILMGTIRRIFGPLSRDTMDEMAAAGALTDAHKMDYLVMQARTWVICARCENVPPGSSESRKNLGMWGSMIRGQISKKYLDFTNQTQSFFRFCVAKNPISEDDVVKMLAGEYVAGAGECCWRMAESEGGPRSAE
jgi:hypothetical protein